MDGIGALGVLATLSWGLTLYGLARWVAPEGVSRASGGREVLRGPAPGYALYPLEVLEWGRLGVDAGLLEPVCVEAFHQAGRRRLVVTTRPGPWLAAAGSQAVAAAASRVCAEVASRTGVEVVAVEICAQPEGPLLATDWVAIYSPDRLGWSGSARGPRFVLATPARGEGRGWLPGADEEEEEA